MMTVTEKNQAAQTARLREAWKIKPPIFDWAPGWVRTKVAEAIKAGRLPKHHYGSMSAWESLQHALDHCGRGWFDHAGRIKLANSEWALVSEPYGLCDKSRKELQAFCDALRVSHQESRESWHYPGYTMRITIVDPSPIFNMADLLEFAEWLGSSSPKADLKCFMKDRSAI